MKLTPQQYATALFDAVSETAPHHHDAVLDKFVKILEQNGDLGKFDEIDAEFRKLKLASEGIKEAEVTVARETEINHQIVHELNQIINADVGTGLQPVQSKEGTTANRSLQVKTRVDESIIGGVMVRVDDTLIDASVKRQLLNLNQSLKK